MSNPGTASEHLNSPQYSETRATFPTPPAMGHPSTMHKHLESPYNAQTSALNQTPHAIDAIPDLAARDASSLPYPMQDCSLPQQLLQEQEAKWDQSFQDQAREHQQALYLKSLEYKEVLSQCSDEGLERYEKKNQEILEQSVEIASLIVESTPPIFLILLTDI